MFDKKSLIEQHEEYKSLSALANHSEWKVFVKILQDMYSEAVAILIKEDSVDARARCRAIEAIADIFESKISLGKNAIDELSQMNNHKLMGNTGQ